MRSIRSELLDRVLPLGEAYLRWSIKHYLEHYHRERNHQGLAGALIDPEPGVGKNTGRIVRRMRVGGLLSYHYREAG